MLVLWTFPNVSKPLKVVLLLLNKFEGKRVLLLAAAAAPIVLDVQRGRFLLMSGYVTFMYVLGHSNMVLITHPHAGFDSGSRTLKLLTLSTLRSLSDHQ